MTQQRQGLRVLAGFSIIAGIVACTLFLFFITDITRALREDYSIVAVFAAAEGLQVGSPVWVAGRQVGNVASIDFRPVHSDSTASIALTILLPREVQPQVRRDSRIRITRPNLTAEPVIDISPGSSSVPALVEGDTIFGNVPPTIMAALRGFRGLLSSLDSLRATTRQLGPPVRTTELRVRRVLRGLAGVDAEFDRLMDRWSTGSARLFDDPQLRAAVADLGSTFEGLESIFADAAARYDEPQLRDAFTRLNQRVRALSARFRMMQTVLANSSLNRLATDSAITRAMNAARVELDSIIAVTKREPLRFWLGPGSGRPLGDPLRR